MSDMTIQQAVAEAKRFGVFIRAFEKLDQVAESVLAGAGHLHEIKASIAKMQVEREAAKEEIAQIKIDLDRAKEETKSERIKLKDITDKQVAAAHARTKTVEDNIAATLRSADEALAVKAKESAEIDVKIAARKAELDELEKKLEKVQAQARKLLGG